MESFYTDKGEYTMDEWRAALKSVDEELKAITGGLPPGEIFPMADVEAIIANPETDPLRANAFAYRLQAFADLANPVDPVATSSAEGNTFLKAQPTLVIRTWKQAKAEAHDQLMNFQSTPYPSERTVNYVIDKLVPILVYTDPLYAAALLHQVCKLTECYVGTWKEAKAFGKECISTGSDEPVSDNLVTFSVSNIMKTNMLRAAGVLYNHAKYKKLIKEK